MQRAHSSTIWPSGHTKDLLYAPLVGQGSTAGTHCRLKLIANVMSYVSFSKRWCWRVA